jgi:hypothetical protein
MAILLTKQSDIDGKFLCAARGWLGHFVLATSRASGSGSGVGSRVATGKAIS